MLFRLLICAAFCLLPLMASAQGTEADGNSLLDMGLEDLMKVSIATRGQEINEADAPGLITVITREQIKGSGARSLIDVLKMVPSFQFGSDYSGTIALGVRGMWAIEGKVQFMIDGIEMSDLFYNSYLFEYSFPVQQISRIEIIRGPGSIIYGNAAEYAVINVITLNSKELDGAKGTVEYGRMREGLERKTLSLAYGKQYSENLEVSAKVFGGKAGATDRQRSFPDGSVFPGEETKQDTQIVNLMARYRGWTAQFVSDVNNVTSRDSYLAALNEPSDFGFSTYSLKLAYKWDLSPRWTINPSYLYKRSIPYHNDDPTLTTTLPAGDASSEFHFDFSFYRHRILVPVNYMITDDLDLLFGAEFYEDEGRTGSNSFYPDEGNGIYQSNRMSFETYAGFSELTWRTGWGTWLGGGRFEHHNYYGDYFVPRFAWTKQHQAWNFKALYSYSYRNPSIGNASYTHYSGSFVDPEKTRVLEIETGYKFNRHLTATANLFDVQSKKTLVYDPITYGYFNGKQTGSYGAELNTKYSGDWGFSILGMTWYNASTNEVARYEVPQNHTEMAAFANYKATWDNKFMLNSNLSLRLAAVHTDAHYGFFGDTNNDGVMEVRKIKSSTIFNLFTNYENLFVKGLGLGVGVANVFDADEVYAVPYDLGRDPLSAPSREWIARLTYTVNTF